MTRDEAKKIAMEMCDRKIAEHGEDYVFLRCPMPGKNSWTLAELKQALTEDRLLDGGIDIIDDIIKYDEWEKSKKRFGMKLALKIFLTVLTVLFFGMGILAVHTDKKNDKTADRWTSPMIFGIVGFEIVYIIWNV